jgi:predicted ATPase
MILVFTGAHGAGKTTLCERIEAGSDLPFFKSEASATHRSFGVSPGADLPLETRFLVQSAILSNWLNQFHTAKRFGGGIFDRCPIDFAAYMLAGTPREADGRTSFLIQSYIQDCMKACRDLDLLLLCHPHGTKMEARGEDKPDANNEAFASLIHHLIVGFLFSQEFDFKNITAGPIEARLDQVAEHMNVWFKDQAEEATLAERGKCQRRNRSLYS